MDEAIDEDRSRRPGGWSRVIFGTIAAVCGGVGYQTGAPETAEDWIGAVFAGAFLIGGVVAVVLGVRTLQRARLFGAPALAVPGGTVLPLGRVVTAGFQRQSHGRIRHRPQELTAALVCEETVTHDVGSMVKSSTRELRRHRLAMTVDQRQDLVSAQIRIEVPLDAPPSLSVHHNEVTWSVHVHTQVGGFRDDTCVFRIVVLPEAAPEPPG